MQIAAANSGPVATVTVRSAGSAGAETTSLVERGTRTAMGPGPMSLALAEASLQATRQGTAQGVFLDAETQQFELAPLHYASGARFEAAHNGAGLLASRVDGELQAIVGANACFAFGERTDGSSVPAQLVSNLLT